MDEKMIGENILEALRKNGMNQAELAEKIGKTQVTVSRYVNGHRAPKAGTLKAIADALGTTTDALMKDKSNKVAISKQELGFMCVYSERYALGRESPAVFWCTRFIKEHLQDIPSGQLDALIRDIEHPIYGDFSLNPWGSEFDKEDWMRLLHELIKEVERRI